MTATPAGVTEKTMKWITRDDMAATAADRWKDQYPELRRDSSMAPSGRTEFDVHHSLLLLGRRPRADDVDEIIGNNSWTTYECDNCNEEAEAVCEIATVFDDDVERPVLVCEKCIKQAWLSRR